MQIDEMNFGMRGRNRLPRKSGLMDGCKQPLRKHQPRMWNVHSEAEF
jgi:hypothetical protein